MNKLIAIALSLCFFMASPAKANLSSLHLNSNDRVVFLGDSITYLGAKDPSVGNPWFLVLQQDVENAIGGNIRLFNSGVGGYTTTKGLVNFNQLVLSLNPTVCVIWLGINDIDSFTPPLTTNQNIEAMISLCTSRGIKVVLVSPMAHGEKPDGQNPPYDAAIDSYSHFLHALAITDSTNLVYYMPMRAYFLMEEKQVNPAGNSG